MFLLIVLLSYLLGCASTIALLLYLYTRYVIYTPVVRNEHQEDQYESFKPLPENGGEKNSAVEAINYLFQFLFQELKDSSRLRRYLMHKLNTEFKELKNSRTGKIFLQNIVIQAFSIGKECPVFSDIHLEHQERDERNLIKGFVARLDADYKDGFSVTLDITLLFGHKCQLFVKVKRIQGNLRLEFRREPFCHWLCVFQKEPLIDFEVKSIFASGESPQLAQIITQQLRRAIKRKQTWPSYKIRLQPFFSTSKIPESTEVLTPSGKNIIPGSFDVLIKYCDRLSIPLTIFDKQKASSVFVFLTVSVNEDMCADYLHIKREQWPRKEIFLKRNVHKLSFKEVSYMDRTELLIEDIDPLPTGIDNESAFKAALQDKNVFLLKIQDQDAATSKQVNRLLKYKSPVPAVHDGTATTTTTTALDTDEDRIKIVVGMPVLHSVRVQRAADLSTPSEGEKLNATSPTLSTRSDHSATSSLSPSTTVRQRVVPPPVKFDKAANSIGIATKQADADEEDTQSISTADSPSKVLDGNPVKKSKQAKTSGHDIVLIMMNTDLLQKFHAEPVPPRKAEPYIEFNDRFNFQVQENERFLNVCLWCKPPLNCDVQDPGKKLILLGYATVALSEIVLDAHMSYKHETQMTVNFRSPYAPKPNLNACLTEEESKKRMELSTHKGYDENLANGFVTINIKHWPEIEAKMNPQEKKEQFIANNPILNDICTELKEKERKQDQLKYINAINEQHELPPRKPTDHIFEDKTFAVALHCDYCSKKIWMKSGRHCRDCLINIHKKCEDRCNTENPCPHVPVPAKSIQISSVADDDSKSILNIELPDASTANSPATTPVADNIDSVVVRNNFELVPVPDMTMNNRATTLATPPTTVHRLSTKAAGVFSVLDSTARRSFRGAFGNKNLNHPAASISPSLSATSELSKSDESLSNASTLSGSSSTKVSAAIPPVQTSSKLANAASSAYSKLRELKARRLPAATAAAATATSPSIETPPIKKNSASSNSMHSEIIPEVDMREVISKILSDEINDVKTLETFLHERDIDDAVLYAKAREFGPELFPEYTLEERKEKLEGEISRLRQEIDLQYQVRDDMMKEYENNTTDDNEKRKLREKILNIDEKVQALGALTILNCYGLKHCRTQIEAKNDVSDQLIDETFNGEDTNDFDALHDDDDDDGIEQS